MLSAITYKIRSISLIWKLLIPFLCFSFIGTTTLVFIGLTSQQGLIKEEEQKENLRFYRLFLAVIAQKQADPLPHGELRADVLEDLVERTVGHRLTAPCEM